MIDWRLLVVILAGAAGSIWFCRELLVNGVYRGGFFNYRVLWGLMICTLCGTALFVWSGLMA